MFIKLRVTLKEGITKLMTIKPDMPQQLQIRLTSSVELIRASLDPYLPWIEQTIGVPVAQTLTLEVNTNPGDMVAEQLLPGLPLAAGLAARKRSWDDLIEDWVLPPNVSPRIAVYRQRERQPRTAPVAVWDFDWQDCPVAFRLKGLERLVVSVKVPVLRTRKVSDEVCPWATVPKSTASG